MAAKWNRKDWGMRDGVSVQVYWTEGNDIWTVESRKKAIPHAGREGVWYHTSFYAINNETKEEKEFCTRKDAFAYVEGLL